MVDYVNHPPHYTDGKIEVIDFIEDKRLGFHLGNAVKYIARAGKKDPEKTSEDLQKAIWYINRYGRLICWYATSQRVSKIRRVSGLRL